MSDSTYQSTIDWKASPVGQPTRIKTAYPISTITHTDYITSTVISLKPTSIDAYQTSYAEDLWEHRIHRFLPVILAFAIIGILTVLGSLVYLAYRFYQANRSSRRRRLRRRDAEETLNFEDENNKKSGSPISTTLSNIIPWLAIPSPLHPTERSNHQPLQREPIRYEKSDLNRIMLAESNGSRRPSAAPSWLAKMLPAKFRSTPRHMSLPILNGRTAIDNLNVPISSTFKPIDKSFLTLVPRSEIWMDPDRRRGVDELDIWERKKSGTIVAPEEPQPAPLMWRFPSASAYPDSPDSDRGFTSGGSNRRSIHIESRRSSTTIMQDGSQKNTMGRTKSESTRYDDDDEPTIASGSVSYPNALSYHQEEEDQEDEHFSRFAITVKLPKSQVQKEAESSSSNDVRLARQVLETSHLKNSSSQWLQFSGSKSF